jgi:hypothetical protein
MFSFLSHNVHLGSVHVQTDNSSNIADPARELSGDIATATAYVKAGHARPNAEAIKECIRSRLQNVTENT